MTRLKTAHPHSFLGVAGQFEQSDAANSDQAGQTDFHSCVPDNNVLEVDKFRRVFLHPGHRLSAEAEPGPAT